VSLIEAEPLCNDHESSGGGGSWLYSLFCNLVLRGSREAIASLGGNEEIDMSSPVHDKLCCPNMTSYMTVAATF
jgi:hypothetical protein